MVIAGGNITVPFAMESYSAWDNYASTDNAVLFKKKSS